MHTELYRMGSARSLSAALSCASTWSASRQLSTMQITIPERVSAETDILSRSVRQFRRSHAESAAGARPMLAWSSAFSQGRQKPKSDSQAHGRIVTVPSDSHAYSKCLKKFQVTRKLLA